MVSRTLLALAIATTLAGARDAAACENGPTYYWDGDFYYRPVVGYAAQRYLLLSSLHAFVLDDSGALIADRGEIVQLPDINSQAIASSPSGHLVIGLAGPTNGTVLATLFDIDGNPTRSFTIAVQPADTHYANPAVAFDGSAFVVAWVSGLDVGQGHEYSVWMTRVDVGGTVAFPPIEVRRGEAFHGHPQPILVSSPAVTWLLWADFEAQDQVLGTRIGPTGQLLDPGSVVVATGAWVEAAAFDGTGFLVLLTDARTSSLETVRLDANGAVAPVTTLPVTRPDAVYVATMRLVARPGGAVVGWTEEIGPGQARVLPVDATGAALAPRPIDVAIGTQAAFAPGANGEVVVAAPVFVKLSPDTAVSRLAVTRVLPDDRLAGPATIDENPATFEKSTCGCAAGRSGGAGSIGFALLALIARRRRRRG